MERPLTGTGPGGTPTCSAIADVAARLMDIMEVRQKIMISSSPMPWAIRFRPRPVTIESIISKDNFVTNIVLAQITILAYEAPVLVRGTVEVVYSAADLLHQCNRHAHVYLTAPPAVAVEGPADVGCQQLRLW